jgi:hypothetical protein
MKRRAVIAAFGGAKAKRHPSGRPIVVIPKDPAEEAFSRAGSAVVLIECRSEWLGNGCVGQVVRIAHEFLNIDLAGRRLIKSGSGTGDEPDERSKAKDGESANQPESLHVALH